MEKFKTFITESITFKGTFNWYGENHILYTVALNKDTAFRNFISQLSKKLKQDRQKVLTYINNKGNSYKIEKE